MIMMESTNLLIRKSEFEDCALFAKWERQPYIMEYMTISNGRNYEEVVREFVVRELSDTERQFTITLREQEDRPIGRIYLSRINPEYNSVDITRIYIGEEDCLRKGYGEEAMRLILEYCFIHFHAERVTLDHFIENENASKLYKKLGFQYEGILRHAGKKDGRYFDFHLMSMLRSEYYAKHRGEH